MCGRFTLKASATSLRETFPLFDLPEVTQRFNVAPTQVVLAVRQTDIDSRPRGELLRWGLIPFWAADKSIGSKMINARADTVATKPAFRVAFRQRRCLVLADGFYEWRKVGKQKVPFHIRLKDGRPFAFAGLWEHWDKEKPPIDSCTIVTTDANDLVRSLHDRMPVILQPQDYARWLDPAPKEPALLEEMLQPFTPEQMEMVEVSPRVNHVKYDDAACLELEKGLF